MTQIATQPLKSNIKLKHVDLLRLPNRPISGEPSSKRRRLDDAEERDVGEETDTEVERTVEDELNRELGRHLHARPDKEALWLSFCRYALGVSHRRHGLPEARFSEEVRGALASGLLDMDCYGD